MSTLQKVDYTNFKQNTYVTKSNILKFSAPNNCLQYYATPSGQVTSFNYELGPRLNSDPSNQIDVTDLSSGIGYFNSMDYTICFRKESGFCTQTYFEFNDTMSQGSPNYYTFHLRNAYQDNPDRETVGKGEAGTGVQKCPSDYLLLNGLRLCGYHLNSNTAQQTATVPGPVTDTSAGPFTARFVSNDIITGRGFKLQFQQNPCGSSPQSTIPIVYNGKK